MTMRVLKCPWTEEWSKPEAPAVLPAPYQMLLSSDYIQGANDHRREDLMTEAAGQGVGFVTSMKPARQILFDMVEEALASFEERVGELA
jgi:NAD(P)H-dependent flavin oxidoreductase YrpB (nitropropane dioxygenase family)